MKNLKEAAAIYKRRITLGDKIIFSFNDIVFGKTDEKEGVFYDELGCESYFFPESFEDFFRGDTDYFALSRCFLDGKEIKKDDVDFNNTYENLLPKYSSIIYIADVDYVKGKVKMFSFDSNTGDFCRVKSFFDSKDNKKINVSYEKKDKKKKKKEKDNVEVKSKKKKKSKKKDKRLDVVSKANKYKNKIKKVVVAQDDAVDKLVDHLVLETAVNDPSEKCGALLVGSSGVGKSLMIKNLAKLMDKDVFIIDSSQLVINGYVGTNLTDELEKFLIEVDYDIDRLENSIIYFEEIDKKGQGYELEVSGKGVLDAILTFFDGASYTLGNNRDSTLDDTYVVDTSKMTVIAGGNFNSVYDKKYDFPTGFIGEIKKYSPTINDYVKKGRMTKDFMGRFPVVIHMKDLDEKDLKEILLNSKCSPLKTEKKVFKKKGFNLEFEDSFVDAVSNKAKDNEIGARALRGIVRTATDKVFSDVCNCDVDTLKKIKKIIINENTIKDNGSYEIDVKTKGKVKREKRNLVVEKNK